MQGMQICQTMIFLLHLAVKVEQRGDVLMLQAQHLIVFLEAWTQMRVEHQALAEGENLTAALADYVVHSFVMIEVVALVVMLVVQAENMMMVVQVVMQVAPTEKKMVVVQGEKAQKTVAVAVAVFSVAQVF